jgi:hypothetical protein
MAQGKVGLRRFQLGRKILAPQRRRRHRLRRTQAKKRNGGGCMGAIKRSDGIVAAIAGGRKKT